MSKWTLRAALTFEPAAPVEREAWCAVFNGCDFFFPDDWIWATTGSSLPAETRA